jgi:hypothetical protein
MNKILKISREDLREKKCSSATIVKKGKAPEKRECKNLSVLLGILKAK